MARQASDVVLHHGELDIIESSIWTVTDAICDRARTLQGNSNPCFLVRIVTYVTTPAVYKLQNLNPKEQIKSFFYGLVSR